MATDFTNSGFSDRIELPKNKTTPRPFSRPTIKKKRNIQNLLLLLNYKKRGCFTVVFKIKPRLIFK